MSSHNTVALAPVCVGQFNLQFPRDGAAHWMINFDWAKVERLPPRLHNRTEFWAYVHARRDALASQHHDSEPSMLYHYETVGDSAALLLHRNIPINKRLYYLERYLWLGDRGYLLKGLGEGEQIKAKLAAYKRIFTRLASVSDVPPAGRFCIDGASVDLTSDLSALYTAEPRGLKHTYFDVSSDELSTLDSLVPTPGEDPRIFSAIGKMQIDKEEFSLARSDSFLREQPAIPKAFDTLRQGARAVAGRLGEEAIWRKTFNNGVVKYRFVWRLADGKPTLHDSPGLILQLDSGDEMSPDAARVPEETLIALWDAVLDSVEKR